MLQAVQKQNHEATVATNQIVVGDHCDVHGAGTVQEGYVNATLPCIYYTLGKQRP